MKNMLKDISNVHTEDFNNPDVKITTNKLEIAKNVKEKLMKEYGLELSETEIINLCESYFYVAYTQAIENGLIALIPGFCSIRPYKNLSKDIFKQNLGDKVESGEITIVNPNAKASKIVPNSVGFRVIKINK